MSFRTGLTGRHATVVLLVVALGWIVTGCGEKTTVTLTELPIVVTGDDSLPDGVVALDNRLPNPVTSFTLACPWGEIPDPLNNPNVFGLLLPDAIPAIDNPKWLPAAAPDLSLIDAEPVIAVEMDGIVRALPIRILLHHEVVNMCWDTTGGAKFSYLTYCPLVDAAVHFVDPRACSAKKKFGVSGAIYNGNLMTFDRATARLGETPEDIFVQLLAGGLFGSCASADPGSLYMSWAMFKRLFPEGRVLSRDTGHVPSGGYTLFDHPYSDYWASREVWFPIASTDNRLGQFEAVVGVLVSGRQKAYRLSGTWALNDTLDTTPITVWNDAGFSGVAAYEAVHEGETLTFTFAGREQHGLPIYTDDLTGSHWNFEAIAVSGPLEGARLPRLMAIRSFWFAWSSMYPDTDLLEMPGS